MTRYNLIFQGKIIDGISLDEVKNNIAQLFKTDAAKTAILFSGKPIVIKKNLDTETTKKYLAVLKKSGAVINAVKIEQPTDNKEEQSDNTAGHLNAGLTSLLNYNTPALQLAPENTGTLSQQKTTEPVELPDISHLTLSEAESGSLEEFAQPIEPVEIPDINHLTMSEANTGSLEEFAIKAEPIELPDISGMDISEQDGTPLSDASPKPTPAKIPDTSSLSMSNAQEGSLEGLEIKPEPVKIPDITHLKIKKSEDEPGN